MNKIISFLFTLAMLLQIGNSLNWQGTGNMSEDNLTQVWKYIKTNFNTSWAKESVVTSGSDTTIVNFTIGFSDHLNNLWADAWNVVVIYITEQSNEDAVLYGYSFRDHWMWYNGFITDDGYYVTFIIWKDYNCIKWFTHNCNTDWNQLYPGSYSDSTSLQTVIQGLDSNLDKSQIWSAAKSIVDALASDSGVRAAVGSSDIAFTMVATQTYHACFFGKFCAKDFMVNYDKIGTKGDNWGEGLVLQMR